LGIPILEGITGTQGGGILWVIIP